MARILLFLLGLVLFCKGQPTPPAALLLFDATIISPQCGTSPIVGHEYYDQVGGSARSDFYQPGINGLVTILQIVNQTGLGETYSITRNPDLSVKFCSASGPWTGGLRWWQWLATARYNTTAAYAQVPCDVWTGQDPIFRVFLLTTQLFLISHFTHTVHVQFLVSTRDKHSCDKPS